jgi:hypothetical protein
MNCYWPSVIVIAIPSFTYTESTNSTLNAHLANSRHYNLVLNGMYIFI